MCKSVGYSVFVSQFPDVRDRLPALYRDGAMIFTSFHIAEEFDETYAGRATEMCEALDGLGYRIIGDVSRRTLEIFGETDLVSFAERMHVAVLRIDYGFSDREIDAVARRWPVCLNASTVAVESAREIARNAAHLYAMHNYYPRPETGLDAELFARINRDLEDAGIDVLAFIPGDVMLRGPLFQGLPTLERHRGVSPYAAFVDMDGQRGIKGIFVGDGIIGDYEAERIGEYIDTGVIGIPVALDGRYRHLEGETFTVRVDSPAWTMRLKESREYATKGPSVEPFNAVSRPAGSVTMDNAKYLRYSGEMQIVRGDLPACEKVNVIGMTGKAWLPLLGACKNGGRIRFVRIPENA